MRNSVESNTLDWEKMAGLIPAIIQDINNGNILMLGYMNKEALEISQTSGQLTLFSRQRQQLWRKGETSGNTMTVISIVTDCDNDSLLLQVQPKGSTCHLGFASCFQPELSANFNFLATLNTIIHKRAHDNNPASYTTQLLQSGIARCAQKVGEEATETVIAAVSNNREELIEETADLIFHLLVLLRACELDLTEVIACLEQRSNKPLDLLR